MAGFALPTMQLRGCRGSQQIRPRGLVFARLNRRISETWYNNSTQANSHTNAQRTISYVYNEGGELTDVTDTDASDVNASAAYHYSYWGDGRLMSTTTTLAGVTPTVTIAKQYNENGNMTHMQGTMVGNTFDFFDTYDYDHLNRLTDLFQFAAPFVSPTNTVAQKSAEFEYNKLGQFTRIERFGGNYDENPNVVSTYSYDHANRLTGLVDTLPDESSTVVASYGWAYDRANRIASFANAVHTSESLNYTYDAAGQLTNYSHDAVVGYGGSYSYDSNGNRTSTSTSLGGLGSATHTYENSVLNQTLSDGQYQYTYDGLGNMTQKVKLDENDDATGETTVYGWDWRNRLTTVTHYASYSTYSSSGASLWHVTYVYDAFNQLVGRKEYDGTTLVKSEHFIYDNGQIVLKLADDGAVKQRYLWAPVVDMLLAQEDGSTNDILWALGDNQNTIRDWVDDSGTVVAHRSYDPFGVANAAFSTGTVDSSFAWTAKFRDERTGLQYNQHEDSAGRWYVPELGKWMSRDPIPFIDGPNDGIYVHNSPTNGIDPTGLTPFRLGPGGSIVGDGGNSVVPSSLCYLHWSQLSYSSNVPILLRGFGTAFTNVYSLGGELGVTWLLRNVPFLRLLLVSDLFGGTLTAQAPVLGYYLSGRTQQYYLSVLKKVEPAMLKALCEDCTSKFSSPFASTLSINLDTLLDKNRHHMPSLLRTVLGQSDAVRVAGRLDATRQGSTVTIRIAARWNWHDEIDWRDDLKAPSNATLLQKIGFGVENFWNYVESKTWANYFVDLWWAEQATITIPISGCCKTSGQE